METIRNYLEAMFANLPNTAEVLRAKRELGQMMEDKYSELRAAGKSENEAVGTVIAEFGNLDELAEDLGLHREVDEANALMEASPRRSVGLDEVKDYLRDRAVYAFGIALGTALCILSLIGPILIDAFLPGSALGAVPMFLMTAVAVAAIVIVCIWSKQWDYLKKELCTIDYATAQYIHDERMRYRASYAAQLTVGIAFCVVSWIPAAVFDELGGRLSAVFLESFGAVFLFLLVAAGVFLILHATLIMGAYDTLLKLNDRTTVSGGYVPEQEEKFSTPLAENVMSVYWPTVRAIYLIWSFATFEWWRTWIIWPAAAVIHAVCQSVLGKKKEA